MSSTALDTDHSTYPLLERLLDLFLDPRRLFESLKLEPCILGAAALSTILSLAFFALRSTTFDIRLPREVESAGLTAGAIVIALLLGVLALWTYLALTALLGMAFAGFSGVDLPYRQWLSLAAHCSLVGLVIVPLEIGGALLLEDPELQLSLADVISIDPHGVPSAFLSRISLRSTAFLALFSLGASVFTGASWWKASTFVLGIWLGLWFMLAWFSGCAA